MTRPVQLTRRHLLAGVGAAAAMGPASPIRAQPRNPQTLAVDATPAPLRLGPDRAETAVWSLRTGGSSATPRFHQDEAIDLTLHNGLPAPLVLNWHGIDGVPSIEPVTARRPASPGETDRYSLPLRQAGTFLCDSRILGDGLAQSSPAQALIVEERTPVEVDRDEVVLIEDWRLDAEGIPTAPGPGGGKKLGPPLYLVNGKPSLDLTLRTNERLRLRFINACQRNAIALGIQNMDLRVIAIDSQPAEPFLARNGRLVLAPGTRVDAVVDATLPAGTTSAVTLHDGGGPRQIAQMHVSADGPLRPAPLPPPAPLPSESLPTRLDLKSALRVDMPLVSPGGTSTSWGPPTRFNTGWTPAFRAKRGRPVVLALTNPAATPMVFHLHGHHFRLLDRLDDGWKPFWLDTILVDAGQTQRVAFAAGVVGAWLVETMAVEWSAPRQVRWFAVE
jgi:FtsP/CotA-like multicopper oxidase with cupredoxin domain